MLPGLGAQAAFSVAERQGEALRDRFAARRDNQADAARLRSSAARIGDVEALLKDRRALTMVLEAFQLESEVDKRAVLRRVLTEDPAASGSLVRRLTDPRWTQLAEAFAAQRATSLDAPQMAAQTAEELRGFSLARMAGLEFFQVQALTPQQIEALDPAQLAAIRPDAITGLDAEDVVALNETQLAALSPAQLRTLSPFQVAAIEPADIDALGTAQLRALTTDQLRALTGDQIRALRPEQVGAFTFDQAQAFTDAQRTAFGPAGTALLDSSLAAPAETPAGTVRTPLGDRVLVDRIIEGAMTNRFEKAMGEANPGLREALYFRRMASQATTIPQLMSDRALLEVTRGALGLPQQFAFLSFEQQRSLITKRLDIADLQDPAKVAKMAQRYLAGREQAQPQTAAAALFNTGGGTAGLVALVGQRVSFRA